jgi:hypothetical protein
LQIFYDGFLQCNRSGACINPHQGIPALIPEFLDMLPDISRSTELPDSRNWIQRAVTTASCNEFIAVAIRALAMLFVIALGYLPLLASAQTCVLNTATDWMVSSDPLAQLPRPIDCTIVEQSPPDFRWPDVIESGGYSLTLIYPDGRTRILPATQNWLNWDEVLPAGTYTWTVGYVGGATSAARKFVVNANSKPFLVPNMSILLSHVSAKAHPRSLPDAPTLALMKSQRPTALNVLLDYVSGHLGLSLPGAGASADDAFTYSNMALLSLQACAYTNQDTYCDDAVRRVVNLSSWDPNGATSYLSSLYAASDMAARYLTWTVALGYDWLYTRLTSSQRSQILGLLNIRNGVMYADVIGSRSRIAKTPRDSHGNQTLTFVALISVLVAGDLPQASTWLSNSLPLALNAISPWGGEESGFANGAAQGLWDVGEMLPLWHQLRLTTGIDVSQKPWVRNWGQYFTYFTPPGMSGGTTVFGDGFEMNETLQQALFGKGYTFFSPTALGRWHASLLSEGGQVRIAHLMAPPADFSGPQTFPTGTPNAIYLPAIGQVAMHSTLWDTKRTSVYFKSSPAPYGAFNHSHADQNSVVVNSGGQRLAIESGYYDDYRTAHWLNWYRTTKAKNAITYDGGQGQLSYEKDNQMGYGRITYAFGSDAYDVVSGDATAAYGGALTMAARTIVYLRPNLILIHDKLASETNRQWEWNIHAVNQMRVTSNTQIAIENNGQSLCVNMLAGPTMQFSQTNQFTANPTGNWVPQWHGTFRSATKLQTAEFVALLNVGCVPIAASASQTESGWRILMGNMTVSIPFSKTINNNINLNFSGIAVDDGGRVGGSQVPGAATIVSMEPGNSEVTVRFSPPLDSGSSNITNYTATCMPGSSSITGMSSPITVAGLTGGITYSCTVTASNSAGSGQESVAANVVPNITLDNGWWWNPAEVGRGFFIESVNGKLFMTSLLYDQFGEAIWYAAGPAPYANNQFSSALDAYSGGQTLLGTYLPPTSSPGGGGSINLRFTDPQHANLIWAGGTIPIERWSFAPGSLMAPAQTLLPQTGWWWNTNESGRAFSIETQGSNLFMGGYMYNSSGNPIWYITAGTMLSDATYQGNWAQYGDGQTIAGSYKLPVLVNPSAGAIALQVLSPTTWLLTLPNGKQLPLTKFVF